MPQRGALELAGGLACYRPYACADDGWGDARGARAEVLDGLMSRGLAEPERVVEIVASGAEPLRELIGAMHSKQLLAELRRQRTR